MLWLIGVRVRKISPPNFRCDNLPPPVNFRESKESSDSACLCIESSSSSNYNSGHKSVLKQLCSQPLRTKPLLLLHVFLFFSSFFQVLTLITELVTMLSLSFLVILPMNTLSLISSSSSICSPKRKCLFHVERWLCLMWLFLSHSPLSLRELHMVSLIQNPCSMTRYPGKANENITRSLGTSDMDRMIHCLS